MVDLQILIGLLLSILPVFELRGGLPIVLEHVVRNGLNVWPYFILVLILNILIIFFIFFFLDNLHLWFYDNWKFYKKWFDKYLRALRKKVDKVENKMGVLGYLALTLFVAIPLPGTGAWTGSFVSWILKLDRWKSILAIAIGVVIAGFLVFFASLSVLSGFY